MASAHDTSTHGSANAGDYEEHRKTYAGFQHMVWWFLAHIALVLAGLYFIVVQHAPIGGGILIAAGVITLGWGVVRLGRYTY